MAKVSYFARAFVSLAIIVTLDSCSPHGTPRTPASAQVELRKLGIQYDERSFLESARNGNAKIVELFLDAGMDTNARSDSGVTALMEASYAAKVAVLNLLLMRGADVALQDSHGATALHRAAASPFGYECVTTLLDRGADPNARAANGETPLTEALILPLSDSSTEFLAPNYLQTITTLLDHGAGVNIRYGRGLTPLMRAAIGGNSKIVRLLLDRGADVNAVSNEGKTAETYALQHHNDAVAEAIRRAND